MLSKSIDKYTSEITNKNLFINIKPAIEVTGRENIKVATISARKSSFAIIFVLIKIHYETSNFLKIYKIYIMSEIKWYIDIHEY